uniref:Uncharacterized protein n=1 Tax=Anopheles albimanus TaxID=7167 RepID=A0A182FYS2_ANOAL
PLIILHLLHFVALLLPQCLLAFRKSSLFTYIHTCRFYRLFPAAISLFTLISASSPVKPVSNFMMESD